MKKIVLVVLVLSCSNVYSQLIGDLLDPNYSNRDLRNEQYTEMKGTPFLFDEWFSGEIKTKLGTTYPNMKIKYEAYSDQLFFLSEDNIEKAVAREKIDFFQFNDDDGKSYLFKHIPYHGFVMVLHENNILLYKKYKKEIKKAPDANGYNNATKKDEFVEKTIYYVAPTPQEIIVPVEKKNQYMDIFGDYQNDIEKFIKKNKVKFKNDAKMIELAKFTESLIN